MEFDKDLRSIQEVRSMIGKAEAAEREFADFPQEQVDKVCAAIAKACADNAERLAKMAVEETGFGIWQDKVLKNLLGSTITYDYIRPMKTVGIIRQDEGKKVWEVAVPMGIVAALIPSTNPTSTVMYKTLIALKAGNAIIHSPHPNAINCILETCRIIEKAALDAGAPAGIVQCISVATPEGTSALLKDRRIGMILATGGEAMVRAAYSSGNPALGVGPGNGPSYIEKSADIPQAVRHIMQSKTFDNGTICASEQSVITEACIKDRVIQEFKAQGGYFLSEEESEKVGRFIMRANGTMNPKIVGRSAQTIAEMAGITIPQGTKVLISMQTRVGKDNPYSREKLCPILGFYVEDNWESACRRSMEILYFTDKTDEFIPDIFRTYGDKAFRSAVDGDLELGDEKQPETADHQETLDFLRETLGSRVDQVKASSKLKSHPVCLTSGEGMTFEMEKYFAAVQPDLALKAKRILEVNVEHPAFAALESARITDPDRAKKYAEILLNQAMLIAGLPLENPSDYTDLVCSLWK